MLTSLLLLIPVIFILFCQLFSEKLAKSLALIGTIVNFGLTLFLLFQFEQNAEIQFGMNIPWIKSFGVAYHVGIDGVSMVMVLLTNLLMPLIILSSFTNKLITRHKLFYSLVLLMQAAMLGVFVSLDGFLYYIFWELALIPIYFILILWGGANKIPVTLKFFIYTLSGSLIMLIAFIYLYFQTPAPSSFSYEVLKSIQLNPIIQGILFWGFFIAFAIKMPIFPFHTWQADTYTTAPSQGTMLLSGIMLKMGIYSVIRWMLPIIPEGVAYWANTAIILCVIGIVYGAWIAIQQNEMKRLFAYSSFSHVGLIAAGILTPTLQGLQGGMIQMLSHGINVIGLFYIAQIIYDRMESTELPHLGGIINKAPKLSILFCIIMFGTVALPLTNGFVGEFLLLNAVFQFQQVLGAVAGLTIILGAVYMLWTFQKSMLGNNNEDVPFKDLNGIETLVLSIIAILVIVIGVFPGPFMDISEPAIKEILNKSTQIYSIK